MQKSNIISSRDYATPALGGDRGKSQMTVNHDSINNQEKDKGMNR